MPTVDVWEGYFSALAELAGVIFAITLAARQINTKSVEAETIRASHFRLWDSVAVTFELAAAAIFAVLFSVRSIPVFPVVMASFVSFWGLFFIVVYFRMLIRLHKQKQQSGLELAFAAVALLPLYAYVLVPAALARGGEPVVAFATAVTWLVLSGTLQATLWYWRSWEHPDKDPVTGESDPAASTSKLGLLGALVKMFRVPSK